MVESFLFVALPYIAIIVCIAGSIYRIKTQSLTYSALSSQFLERRSLMWGSLPWHLGIIAILGAHIVAFMFPGFWQALVSYQPVLLAIEAIGLAAAFACFVGLSVLVVRRLISAKVQSVTSTMDLVVLGLLLVQVALGIGVAMTCRWGSAWTVGTAVPYVWSILKLQPDTSYISNMPLVVKAHIIGGWLLVFTIPFSRLIHMFALPIHYILRSPQVVVWSNPRRLQVMLNTAAEQTGRRYFLRGAVAVLAGGFLLSIGAIDRIFLFFFGPRLTKEEESELMETRLSRLEATAHQRQLELERQQSNYISLGALSDLSSTEGKYFIDYEMRPGMAFLGADGLPNLLSAKCTHLGCTVGNQVDAQGKILCPCHVSYFDVKTGVPNADAPAKAPLPHLAWVLMDKQGKVLTQRTPDGTTTGVTDTKLLANAQLFLLKQEGAQA